MAFKQRFGVPPSYYRAEEQNEVVCSFTPFATLTLPSLPAGLCAIWFVRKIVGLQETNLLAVNLEELVDHVAARVADCRTRWHFLAVPHTGLASRNIENVIFLPAISKRTFTRGRLSALVDV